MDAPPRPRRRGVLALALLALLPLAAPSIADAQGGLYGPEAPADAAWVRVVNAGADDGVVARIGDGEALDVAPRRATGYVRVDPGSVPVEVDGDVLTLEVGPESFTTVAATAVGPVAIPDPALRDISRGLLGLVNLTGLEGLDLQVPDGPIVVGPVPPGAHDAIAVAEASTELVVVHDGTVVARLEARTFERGIAYAVVVVETAAGVEAFVLTAAGE